MTSSGDLPRRPSIRAGETGTRLSRGSHVPLYYQLAVILENRVEAGRYLPGGRFPSDHELCAEFQVSRTVVRPAVAILEREGRVERHRGHGTLVRPPKVNHPLGGMTRALSSEHSDDWALKIIEVRNDRPRMGELLRPIGPSGGQIARVTAVLLRDGNPTALYWSFLSEHDVPWVKDLSDGQVVQAHGLALELRLVERDSLVETSWATDFESSCLKIVAGSPVLVAYCHEVAAVGASSSERLVEVAWMICRSDAMRLSVSSSSLRPTIK